MEKQSRYSELFDRYQKVSTTKRGTKYEVLTAFVFKSLCEAGVVVHDIRLIGENNVPPAQIDVCIEVGGAPRRILIECKDFDVSGDPVGIGIIRGFCAVVMDLRPDESFVITCNRFTEEAVLYAKAKGIKLAILREFREEDKEDRITKFHVNIKSRNVENCGSILRIKDEESRNKWCSDLKKANIAEKEIIKSDKIFINTPSCRFKLIEFLDKELNAYPRKNTGHVIHKVATNGFNIEIENMGGIPIGDLILDFDIVDYEYSFELISQKIARLILEKLDENDEVVIFEDDLKRYKYDPNTREIQLNENKRD